MDDSIASAHSPPPKGSLALSLVEVRAEVRSHYDTTHFTNSVVEKVTPVCPPPPEWPLNSSLVRVRVQDISHFICRREWALLNEVLASKADHITVSVSGTPLELRSCLHLACRFDPPLASITALYERFPDSNCDMTGKYPIHFAAEWGASPSVIEYLAKKNPTSVDFQDSSGKTPLHYMCESYAKSCKMEKEGHCVNARMLKVAKILCHAAPMSLNIEDAKGMNAIEYAIEAGVDYKVVRCLQKLSQKEWQARQKAGLSHPDIEKVFKEHFEDCKKVIKRENSLIAIPAVKCVAHGTQHHSSHVRTRRETILKKKGCHLEKAIAA